MDVSDAAYHTVHDYPGGAVALGPRLHINSTVLNSKVLPSCQSHHLTLDEAVRVMALTGDHRILVALCRRLGYLDPIPAVAYEGIADEQLLEMVARMHGETSDVSRSLVDALADGRVTRDELARFEVEAQEAMTAIATLLDRVRGMVVETPARRPPMRAVR